MSIIAALALLATAGPAARRVHAQAVRLPPVSRIDAIFARYDTRTTPGCAVSVLHADSVLFRKAYGMTHVGHGVQFTTATTTWIPYSEARTFVALAVAQLARDGALSLDDRVRTHIAEVPAYASGVTVRHLLHHTSGLADYGALDFTFDLTDRVADDQMFRALARWGQLGFPAGAGHMYSNTDYALLRILVERVSGRSLHDYLHATVLDRLGMRDTWLGADQARVPGAHSLFHDASWRPVLRYRISPVGGISVTTSADDLGKWALALRDTTNGIRALLTSLEGGKPDTADTYGLAYGIGRRTDQGLDLEEYRGVEGYRYLTRVPSLDLSVVLLCNHYDGIVQDGPRVAALFAGRDAPVTERTARDTVPPVARPTVPTPRSELQRYVGEYRTPRGDVTGVRVMLEDSVLVVTLPSGDRYTARPLGGGLFELQREGADVWHSLFRVSGDDILLSERDVVTGAQVGGEEIERYEAMQYSAQQLQEYVGAYEGERVEGTLHVTVDGDRLMIAARGLAPIELAPAKDADTFRVPDYLVRFSRDAGGRVSHVTFDARRVQGMRYARQRAPAN